MKTIETIIDTSITKTLYSIYDLDIDGFVHNKTTVKTLRFKYRWPVVNFLEPIFMEFFETMNSQYIYMTGGANIKEDEHYLNLARKISLNS
jgi:hypothetical protein